MSPSTNLTVRVADQIQTVAVEGRRTQVVLSALLRQAGVTLNTRCSQRGLCDGCLVDLLSGQLIDAGTGAVLPATGQPHSVRACQYHLPPEGNVEIHVPGRSLLAHEPQVVTSFRINVSRDHDPLWQRVELTADDAATGYGTAEKPLAQAICEAVARQRDYDLPVRAAPELEQWTGPLPLTSLVLEQSGDAWLVRPAEADDAPAAFGIAVDVGTTTVVCVLVDLGTGEIVNTASGLNAQVRLGDNVLTRIQMCITHPKMIGRLQHAVVSRTLRPLIEQLLLETGVSPQQIRSLVIAGNTTMLHLFAGIDPSSMGMAPFTPQFIEHRVLRTSELPLRVRPKAARAAAQDGPPRQPLAQGTSETGEDAPNLSPNLSPHPAGSQDTVETGADLPAVRMPPASAERADRSFHAPAVHLLPGAAAYVGADVMAGVFASGMVYGQETSLLVDVGTNGEIVLKQADRFWGCATAAGPAFEGSGLSCGMRAGRGAISHIRLDHGSDTPEVEVIGGAPPVGVCGTAYVDFVAQARVTGLLRHNGRFSPEADRHPRVRPGQHGREFVVADGADGKPIYISESDVARLLQAKAAIAAGIVCLLNCAGLTPPEVRILYLAGGFGFHMDVENVIRCGLLPGFRPEQISLVGNTSLAGAYLALLDSSVLDEIKKISVRLETIELNLVPGFESCYIDQLAVLG
jgi:uncharacterized 2Fe-2S/4Fe-4S cluster protein (DUF4445 family)